MNKKEIEQALKDYKWMLNEIVRERRELAKYDGGNMVAQAGLEAVMPKAQGGNSDPVAVEVVRRDESSMRVKKLERKVSDLQQHMAVITDIRERVVLECILDGLSMTDISRHMNMSRRHIYTMKNAILDKMANTSQFAQFSHVSTQEKQCV